MVSRASTLPTVGASIDEGIRGRLHGVEPIIVPRSSDETPEQARERRERADAGRRAAWAVTLPKKFRSASLSHLYDDQHPEALRGLAEQRVAEPAHRQHHPRQRQDPHRVGRVRRRS